jgi:hypothetical protein
LNEHLFAMKIGITGTRKCITQEQQKSLHDLLESFIPYEMHHGDCIGADAQAHSVAILHEQKTVLHKPINTSLVANCLGDEERLPLEYHARDRQIVIETDILIALPLTEPMQTRGGTYYTFSFSEKMKKPSIIIWPNGRVQMVSHE